MYGFANSPYIGFMDNLTPARVKQNGKALQSLQPDRVWFRLDKGFIDINQTKILSGPPDQKGFCAYNIATARTCFAWFAVTKAVLGNYPRWANQTDLWTPDFTRAPAREAEFYRLCFAFGLAENRCVVTRFEADNPVPGAPEVFVDNPLCPGNPSAFWATVLAPEFAGLAPATDAAARLVEAVTNVYKHWATKVCTSQMMTDVGLKDEAYFKYFDAPDFLTPRAGLVQIRAYAQRNPGAAWYPELQSRLTRLADLREAVKAEIHRLLVGELAYFS